MFITSNAQLLSTPAEKIRPRAAPPAVAGIKLTDNATVIEAAFVDMQDAEVATCRTADDGMLYPTQTSLKVTRGDVFPPKGRATRDVRCHRFLKGEDVLTLARVCPAVHWRPVRQVNRSTCPRLTIAATDLVNRSSTEIAALA